MSMVIIAIRLPNEASVTFILLFIWFCLSGAHAADTLRPINWLGSASTYNYEYEGGFPREPLTLLTSNQTLVSSGGGFKLGFFGGSNKFYLGIWFKNDTDKKYGLQTGVILFSTHLAFFILMEMGI